MLSYSTEAVPIVGEVGHLKNSFRSINFITGTTVVFQQPPVAMSGCANKPQTTASHQRRAPPTAQTGCSLGELEQPTSALTITSWTCWIGKSQKVPTALKSTLSNGWATNCRSIWHKCRRSYTRELALASGMEGSSSSGRSKHEMVATWTAG